MGLIRQLTLYLFIFLLPTQLGKYFFFDFSHISGVRVDYLAPALYLTDILVIALIILYRKKLVAHLKERVSFILIVGLLFVNNIAMAPEPYIALYWIIKLIEMYLVYIIFRSVRMSMKGLLLALGSSAMLQLGLAIAQFAQKSSLQGVFYYLGERYLTLSTPGVAKASFINQQILRPYGTFSHPNSLGGFYVLLYAFALTIAYTNKSRSKLLALALSLLSAMLVFISFSKTAIITLIIVSLLQLFFFKKEAFTCKLCFIAKLIIPILIGLMFLQAQADPSSLEKRWYLAEQSIEILSQNLTFGTGFGNYLYFQGLYPSPYDFFFVQPVHNIFILFILQAGLLLSLILGYSLLRFTQRYWRSLSLCLAALLITGMLDHYWLTLQQNILLLSVVFGMIVRSRSNYEKI